MSEHRDQEFIAAMWSPDLLVYRDVSTGRITKVCPAYPALAVDYDRLDIEVHEDGTFSVEWEKRS